MSIGHDFGRTQAKRASVKKEVFYAQNQVAKLKAARKTLKARLELGTTQMVFGTKKALRQKAAAGASALPQAFPWPR